MEFSATWSSGGVPSDFDFLMSFVVHVTDTYPTSVFDVAYRPVMLTGVMLTGGSEALQNRSAALARDALMGFQLALGLPEDASDLCHFSRDAKFPPLFCQPIKTLF